jgi:hypothetical protein
MNGIHVSLKVEEYTAAENEALNKLPNRIIEAGGAAHFSQVGYPFTAQKDKDVWRFADAMHELGEASTFDRSIQGLTDEEFILIKNITSAVHKMCKDKYGQVVVPKGALSQAIIPFRLIRAIQPAPSTIIEIGAGSGYLGALLALSGYTYLGVENAQGFYLYQSALWQELFGESFQELANDDRALSTLGELPTDAIVHIPWWKFYGANPEASTPNIDLVTSNHALCEMNRSAFGFTSAFGRDLLRQSSAPSYFLCEGPGAGSQRSRGEMQALMSFTGLEHVYSRDIVDVFSPKTFAEHLWIPETPDDTSDNVSNDGTSTSEPVRVAKHAIELIVQPGGVKTLSNKARSYIFGTPLAALDKENSLDQAAHSTPGVPFEIDLPHSKVGKLIEDAEIGALDARSVSFAELEAFRHEFVGVDNYVSEDEKFMKYAYSSSDW